jgi:transposase-like protein
MRSPDIFCPNKDCPASGQTGQGNIRIHGKTRPRFKCQVCGKTFSARAGTIFFRRRTDEATITCVVTLVGNGCPVPAIEAAFGLQAQTVREWVEASGTDCEQVHQDQVLRPREGMCKPTRSVSKRKLVCCGWRWR